MEETLTPLSTRALRQRAHRMDVGPISPAASRNSIIRAIQSAGGREPCFLTDNRYTCREACEWREDCTRLTAEWLR